MSLPEEIKKAMKIIDTYKESVSDLLSKKVYTCVCCKKSEIKAMYSERMHPLKPDEICWDGGGVKSVNFGWGSRHDLETFFIGICDDCIEELEKEGLIVPYRTVQGKLKEIDEEHELF